MRAAIRSAAQLRCELGLPAGDPATAAAEALFPTFVSREFASRIERGNLADPLLRQVLPVAEEALPQADFVADPVGDQDAYLGSGLLQKYARRALVVATGVCGVHCRYCFRREFDYSALAAHRGNWNEMVAELTSRPEIDEVILSGGDPLTLADGKWDQLVAAIESVVTVKRLRIHSRMPIVIPSRIDQRFVDRLRSSRLVPWMVVHCNHVNEIDDEVVAALAMLTGGGIPVLNQAVLLRDVNDSVEALESLCRRLVDLRVQPYYLHQLDRVRGAAHFEVAVERGRELIESLRELLPGYAVPRYVFEQAGMASKSAL